MAEIGVVHLVRESNDIGALQSFVKSYFSHPAGIEHELVMLLKGFKAETLPQAYLDVLQPVQYQKLFIPDRGFDLGAYFLASAHLDHKYLCFLNSYSQILCDDWLKILFSPLLNVQVGAVSATASYQSHLSNYWHGLANSLQTNRPSRSWWRRLAGKYVRQRRRRYLERVYDAYPNYHLRTNAFIVSRQLMQTLKRRSFRNKNDLWEFESGKNGFTRQIETQGLEVLVVGRDGKTYQRAEWRESMTFSNGSQENLLIADNQTQLYALSDEAGRADLYRRTWCQP